MVRLMKILKTFLSLILLVLVNTLVNADTGNLPGRSNRPPNIVVQIADNGIGIPQDELPFIFEPFYRVDKSRTKDTGGYGLGLSLCKTIMEAHDGKIEIQSRAEEGTTVSLWFPLPKS